MCNSAVPIRKIIHVDMDAFYASVELLDNPSLEGQPIVVGGGGARGVISAASYEARKYGVKSAMSGRLAEKLCPNIVFLPHRFERYKAVSKTIRRILLEYTHLVEPLSLDEAYLDVTTNKLGIPSATVIAERIRTSIYNSTGLTASAGISINKFVAKIASDYNKPNGQKTITPEEVIPFLEQLDIRKFYGIGKVTAEKMYNKGIFTGKDLKLKSLEELTQSFGKSGAYYYNVVRGIHLSEVKPNRIRKSLAAERTFSNNLSSEIFLVEKLQQIAKEVTKRLVHHNLSGKTITIKIKYSDFKVQTRSKTLPYFVKQEDIIFDTAKMLLYQKKLKNSVRLIGISVTQLNTEASNTYTSKIQPISVQLKFKF